MKRFAPVVIALVVGAGGLLNFSPGVRTVQVVGLFASGAAFGAGLVRFILGLRGKLRD